MHREFLPPESLCNDLSYYQKPYSTEKDKYACNQVKKHIVTIRDEILNLDVNNLTPLEALNKLNDIKKIVKGK